MGNTCRAYVHFTLYRDHPHLRGEHLLLLSLNFIRLGSPPPTWGTRNLTTRIHRFIRITPTYVGNTLATSHSVRLPKDHPHLRGEHYQYSSSILLIKGSPPPTWGTHERLILANDAGRITPTYVGNTT